MPSSASLLVLLLLGTSGPPAATVPDSVSARVGAWLAQEWGVPAPAVRLEWGRLPGPLPDGARSFRVAGRGAAGWYVVVFDPDGRDAVALRLRAGVEQAVPVAARPLGTGAALTAADVRLEPRVCWGPPAVRGGARPGPGWEVRRALAAGEPLAPPAVVPPLLVEAGAPVRMVWAGSTIQVTVMGVALNRARQGDCVRARVAGRPDPLVGTATAAGTAVIANGGVR